MITRTEKKCHRCLVVKAIDEFYNQKCRPDGKASECSECCRSRWKNMPQEQKDRYRRGLKDKGIQMAADRKAHLKRSYGLSVEMYNEMYDRQRGVCSICHGIETAKNRNLHVDHCHSTGKIRGLLCGNCNRLLGYAKDNLSVLVDAGVYLERSRE